VVGLQVLHGLVDNERMNRHPYTVVSWTTHYRIIDGRVYRDAVARNAAGELRLVAFPDTAAAA
jgi:hypothetical protein